MGQSASTSFQYTDTTTNVDSFNKTFASTSNISESGNVTIALPSPTSSSSGSLLAIMLALAGAVLLVFTLKMKKG